MLAIKADSFAEAYKISLEQLMSSGSSVSPRGLGVREICNLSMEFDPRFFAYSNKERGTQLKYVSAEYIWYFMGNPDKSYIAKYAKMWDLIANADGTVNSCYGNLILRKFNDHGYNQWRWALQSLVKDNDTRQALIHFNLPEHQIDGNKDFVCTVYGIFMLRDGKLNFTVHMRSNDAILGTSTDVAFFCVLQQQMVRHLKAAGVACEIGTYTHVVNSYHVYERHFDLVQRMLNNSFTNTEVPTLDCDLVDENGRPSFFVMDMYKEIEPKVSSEFEGWIFNNLQS